MMKMNHPLLFMLMFMILFLFTLPSIHPLILIILLILYTLLICLIMSTWMLNFMYSIIMFLIMISGLLIIFLYFSSLIPNMKINFFFNKYLLTNLLLNLMFFTYIFKKNNMLNYYPYTNSDLNMIYLLNSNIFSNIKPIYLSPFLNFSLLTIMYLMMSLFIIIKLCSIKYSSLRKLKKYE